MDGFVLADGLLVDDRLVTAVAHVLGLVFTDYLAVGVHHHVRLLLLNDKALVVRLPFTDDLILVGNGISLLSPAVHCYFGAALLL